MLCLVPVFAPQETIDFRFWEGAAALGLAAANLLAMIHVARRPVLTPRRMAGIALLAGLTFFVSPAAGVAIDLCWGMVVVRQLPLRRVLAFASAGLAALMLFLVPWTIRNEAAVHAAVPIRSNFGLELALGNHPGAVNPDDPAAVFQQRLAAIHPYHSEAARQALHRAGGEVAYARALGRTTWQWMAAHPADALRLCLRHYREFFLPEPWQFLWYDYLTPRSLIVGGIDLIGLTWLLYRRRRSGFALVGLYVVTAALPYALVQPIPRYTYIVYALLVYPAVEAAIAIVSRIRRRPVTPTYP